VATFRGATIFAFIAPSSIAALTISRSDILVEAVVDAVFLTILFYAGRIRSRLDIGIVMHRHQNVAANHGVRASARTKPFLWG
jgi:hypothetical protein